MKSTRISDTSKDLGYTSYIKAIGRAVVYFAWDAHAFSAGIKCRHCMSLIQYSYGLSTFFGVLPCSCLFLIHPSQFLK